MELEKILKKLEPKIKDALAWFENELKTLNVGKASTALLEDVSVSYFGNPTPLKQLANISVVDVSNLSVQPFDPGSIKEIEKAIVTAGIGVSATNDGKAIRVSLPPLSEERRKELSVVVKDKAEEARISLRVAREEVWDEIQEREKKGDLTEDDKFKGKERLNKMIEEANKEIAAKEKAKVEEIVKV